MTLLEEGSLSAEGSKGISLGHLPGGGIVATPTGVTTVRSLGLFGPGREQGSSMEGTLKEEPELTLGTPTGESRARPRAFVGGFSPRESSQAASTRRCYPGDTNR